MVFGDPARAPFPKVRGKTCWNVTLIAWMQATYTPFSKIDAHAPRQASAAQLGTGNGAARRTCAAW